MYFFASFNFLINAEQDGKVWACSWTLIDIPGKHGDQNTTDG